MVRKIAGLLAILFAVSLSTAAQDKKETKKIDYSTVIGTFESYKKEILKLKVEDKEKEFKVPGDTPVGYSAGKDKTKILKAKEHLKDVKKGSAVAVTLDGDGKKVLAVGVFVPELPKDPPKDDEKEEKEARE
jgi:polyribonucleotide nucleotidyltransferase